MSSVLVPGARGPPETGTGRLRLLPRSIVGRTTLAIILLASLIGAVFVGIAARTLYRSQHTHLQESLGQLLATVESTVSIACFVKDAALAREIVAGLKRNEGIAGVRILADGATLFEQGSTGDEAGLLTIRRTIHSPFGGNVPVGEIVLYASREQLRAQAWHYTGYVLAALALQTGLIALAIAAMAYNLVTRPIKGISDELHRLEPAAGMRLHMPAINERDEIGRLVTDVNGLLGRLNAVLEDERALRLQREASERRLATIFEKVSAGIFELDATGLLGSWNPAFAKTLGPVPEPPRLHSLLPRQEERLQGLIRAAIEQAAPVEADFEITGPQGQPRWLELSLAPLEGGRLQGVVNDVTDRKQSELAARQMAARDTLTGLLNRRGLEAGLAGALERRARDRREALTVLQVDLDYFKQVNDQHGHHAGDLVLRRVAEVLERAVRRSDLVARIGGDEFTIVLVGAESPAKAGRIARTIIEEVGKPIDIGGGQRARVGVSVGIAVAEPKDPTAERALRRADAALYAAKAAGRNRSCFADGEEDLSEAEHA